MKYLKELREGSKIQDVYLCKSHTSAVTKNGKNYDNVILQDCTGVLDCKIWDPNSMGIEEFGPMDYVFVTGTVLEFNGSLQGSLKQVRKAQPGEYIPADYVPVTSKNRKAMYLELKEYRDSIKNEYLFALLQDFFQDKEFAQEFFDNSAAKTIHHSFMGGLLEHTLSVTKICDFMSRNYPALNRDLLLTAAILHDVGKIRELSDFPLNEYTDEGQLLGHIMIGAEMIHDHAKNIPNFPQEIENELKHCILAHHGELEYGSPKKPALMEAMALNLADNMDAKLETWTELMAEAGDNADWLGFIRPLDTNIRKTRTPV